MANITATAEFVNVKQALPDVPKTGDDSNIQMWIALMFVAIASMIAFYPRRRSARGRQ